MKKSRFRLLVLLFTCMSIMSFTLVSCGNDDDDINPNAIEGGVWVEIDDDTTFDDDPMCVQFNSDHTGAMWVEDNGKIDPNYTYDKFTWTASANVISFKITSGESNWNPMEDYDEYSIKNGCLDWYGYLYKKRK